MSDPRDRRRAAVFCSVAVVVIVLIAVPAQAAVDLFPSSFNVVGGSFIGGTVQSLNADDDDYLVVRGTKGNPASWYGDFTSVDDAAFALTVTYQGRSSNSCTQVISILRWADSTWVQLDTRTVATNEVEVTNLSPPGSPAQYVTGPNGRLRVLVSCRAGSSLNLSSELLKLSVEAESQPLSVTTNGSGSGTVTSSPAGITCPSDCSETFPTGTIVTLTAVPEGSTFANPDGSTFVGWSGACSGTGTCQVTMDAAASVTATFAVTGEGSEILPSSVIVEVGRVIDEASVVRSLWEDDDQYYRVISTKHGTRTATWAATFNGVDNSASFTATFIGLAQYDPCMQVISAFRWADSTWVQMDSRSVGPSEVTLADLVFPGAVADFVSGTSGLGDVRIRVSCSSTVTGFFSAGELLILNVG